ncbi:hypothetical protein RN001_014912 [Aquatica leii]|uniref:C3H1-type domain-containing protein n=1 Tax=Aquatica leii TaxID=1421715 RepID=A0AAN7QC61_9COLE|nr:hypothetical protein RN001_014912 [Aquatica leii]
MEQQAKECIDRKEWLKAIEIYNSLIQKTQNTDFIVIYLQGRSKCLLELGQYEATVVDCRKILKVRSSNSAWVRLVISFFALRRFSDAELVLNEWISISKLDVDSIIECFQINTPQNKCLERELLVFLTKFRDVQDLYPSCAYCNVTCRDKSELKIHCQSESHQTIIMSDEGRDWSWRPPPRGLNAEQYTRCRYWDEKQSCRFGMQCVEAHGEDELTEWKERYKYRQMKLQRAYEKELFGKSYTEQLLEKYMQASSPSLIMQEKLDYVKDACCSNLTTTVPSKSSVKQWTFTLKTNRPLHAIALLHDMHRNYFAIDQISSVTNQSTKSIEIKNDQEYLFDSIHDPEIIYYQVTITFKTDIYGTFRQSVTFDYGYEPVLVKHLCVDVIPVEEAQKLNEIRQEIVLSCVEHWNENNAEIIPFASHDLMQKSDFDTDLFKLYPCPQSDTLKLSHATVSEKKLTPNNYNARMHELLYIEEMARNEETNKYNLTAKLHIVKSYLLSSSLASSTAKYSNFGELYAFMNLSQDLSEDTLCGRLILSNCTSVLIGLNRKTSKEKPKVYEALIEDKGKNVVYLRLSAETVTELHLSPDITFKAQVQFQLNRLPYCEWHYAIDKMSDLKLIFPQTYIEPLIPWSPMKQWGDVDNRLNLKQKEAVIAITTSFSTPLPPILIIGPFGTGKTFTLAQAIKQLSKNPEAKVLICTHSNSAADLYIKDYLHPYVEDGHKEAKPLRIYYQKRWVVTVHPTVQKYCLIQESGGARMFLAPTFEDIEKHRIIVVTLSTSMYLSNLGIPQGYFSHILLDEAAQTMECEAIMPLSLADRNTRIVLAGDHMQISPELFSQFAKDRNLHISLLERLYDHYPAAFPCKILLCENYRAHEAIIDFTSELFYDQKLIASGKQPRHQVLYPLTFFTARGEDVQDVNSTAFYNSSEAYEVVERVSELKRQWPKCWGDFDEHSIGIMTPYSDQVFRIRSELRKRRLGSISVERVLNVQGKQFRAVFLSTVRTRRTCVNGETANDYGFLSNSKLLNTAITRAQSLIAVVGDPIALCSIGRCSKVWERFIQVCDTNKSLLGITWSFLKNQLDGLELKKTYGLNPLAPEFVPRKFQNESYIKLPVTTNAPAAPQSYVGFPITRPPLNYYSPEATVPLLWPVYPPIPNYLWRMPQIHPPILHSPEPSKESAVPIRPLGTPVLNPQGTPQPERDLIQFLDNVHIPHSVKGNHDSLHDLMNLLPDNMSLANMLMQPITFHHQWFQYLLAKKGVEAAKKFEYLMLMATKKDRNGVSLKTGKKIEWEGFSTNPLNNKESDMDKHNLCELPYLEQQTPDLNWFDKPVNQINFNKPVYLKDPLHLEEKTCNNEDIYRPSFDGVAVSLDNSKSVPLYLRQPSKRFES